MFSTTRNDEIAKVLSIIFKTCTENKIEFTYSTERENVNSMIYDRQNKKVSIIISNLKDPRIVGELKECLNEIRESL